MYQKQKKGFTLIELLVVISIIALLAGILLPSLSKARDNSRRVACRALLSGIGRAIELYKGQYNALPWAREFSTVTSSQEGKEYLKDVSIADALAEFADAKQFKCPSDDGPSGSSEIEGSAELKEQFGGKTFFEHEETSYDYFQLWQLEEIDSSLYQRMLEHGDSKILAMNDFEPFHGKPGTYGASNYLFGDGHVSDMIDGK